MVPDPFSTTVVGVAFRYSSYDTPFWVRRNSEDGRWHRRVDGPTQYLSLSPAGAWAELLRHEAITDEHEAAQVQTQMWIARIEGESVADYGDFPAADAAGFDPRALVDEDYSHCQEEGRRLRQDGVAGVLAPSAALPGEVNLTLFGARYSIRWQAAPALKSAVAATVVAVGAPPRGIVAQVRHRGAEHQRLREYEVIRRAEKLNEQSPREQD